MRHRGFAALLVATATLAGAGGARADDLTAVYSVRLIGLSLGIATVSGVIEPNSYRVEAGAKLSGVASLVSNSKGAATSVGSIAQGRLTPSTYATTSSNSDMTRTVRIAMAGGSVRASEVAPPFEDSPDRVPVTEADKRNVIDPLSALVMPVSGPATVGPAACDRKLSIFDGWTRFDINLTYSGARPYKTTGFSGQVAVCSARYVPISGHRANRPSTKFMADNRQMEVWLAPVGSTHVFMPVKIAVATTVGMLSIDATEFLVEHASAAQR